MRPSRTFTISLPPDLVTDVDRLAAQEHRSRSELFREAFRRYVNSQRRWEHFFDLGPRSAVADELDTEETIDAAVDEAIRVVLDTNIIVSGILALWLSSRATNLYQSSCKVVTGAGPQLLEADETIMNDEHTRDNRVKKTEGRAKRRRFVQGTRAYTHALTNSIARRVAEKTRQEEEDRPRT